MCSVVTDRTESAGLVGNPILPSLTPIASRLELTLDEEFRRMDREWFFKWHFIGKDGPVEIDTFEDGPKKWGGVAFSGTAVQIYWETIQRYLRKKVEAIFVDLERELPRYPVATRQRTLTEAQDIIKRFVIKIRETAVETDQTLRGDGFTKPPKRGQGRWLGCWPGDIDARISGLMEIYCQLAEQRAGRRMSYKADVIEVMIASPSDVGAERAIVRDVILEWNAVNSKDRGILLQPVGWESHSAPAMGDRPQEIINKQILKDCDLLIAVFWTKFGTPTGKANSGTAEEIDEHLASGKPALIYFSAEPVVPDSIDSEQYKALKAFEREKMSQGLFARYNSKTEFREKLVRQLAQTIIREFGRSDDSSAGGLSEQVLTMPPRSRIELSVAGRELLLEAVKDQRGTIMRLQTIGSSHVQTNRRDFIQSGENREIARWRGAVDELERLGFIEDRGGKGEVFFVTSSGYDAADQMAQEG